MALQGGGLVFGYGARVGGGALLLTLLLIAMTGLPAADPPAAHAPISPVEVVRSFPHAADAFTQGLIWHQGAFYESTGKYRASRLRRVALEGTVLQEARIPDRYFAEGIALLGGRLFVLSWHGGRGLVFDPQTLAERGTFHYDGEGWGLASDGELLILSDGTPRLRFIDPRSHAVKRTLEVRDGREPVRFLNELEWVRGEIWANVWFNERIARIDPRTGQVKGWLDLSPYFPAEARKQPGEAVLNGIAYDAEGDRIFVTGKLWPVMYEIRVAPPAP